MKNFWENKTLFEMSDTEWESLCDRCGKCCVHKLENDEDGVMFSNVCCQLQDCITGQCKNYANRKRFVPDCVKITPENIEELYWLPNTCAYKLLHQGKKLPKWHPLITKTYDSVVESGNSISHRCIEEKDAGPIEHHIIEWIKC